MRAIRLLEHASQMPARLPDPLIDRCAHAKSIIPSPKEIIKRHLKERKENSKKQTVSEKDLLDAVDILEGAAHSDKETEDMLYALSDLCPYERVKQKAAEALKK